MYRKFFYWMLSGIRACVELAEMGEYKMTLWDWVRYWLVMHLPLPR